MKIDKKKIDNQRLIISLMLTNIDFFKYFLFWNEQIFLILKKP